MHFGKKELNNADYYMSDQRYVTEEKDLGVVIMVAQCNRADHNIFIL